MATLAFSGCSKVIISDEEICQDLGEFGAECFNTLSDRSRIVSPLAWDAERFGRLSLEAATFGRYKATIEKLCSKSDICIYQTEEFYKKLDASRKRAKQLRSLHSKP